MLIKLTAIVGMETPNVPVLQAVWNAALEMVDKPTANEVESWNAIATSTNVPFRFDSTGLIDK